MNFILKRILCNNTILASVNNSVLIRIKTDVCVYIYIYLPFSDKLYAAAVCKKEISLMMAEYFQPKHVGDVKQICSTWSRINLCVSSTSFVFTL
jgi:hypothetical protein